MNQQDFVGDDTVGGGLVDDNSYASQGRLHRQGVGCHHSCERMQPCDMSFCESKLEVEDVVLVLVDHQVGLSTVVKDINPCDLKTNVLALSRVATLAKIPVILTANDEQGPNGRLFNELEPEIPQAMFVAREGDLNPWHEEKFVKTLELTGKKTIIMAGLLTNIALTSAAITASCLGYKVFVVLDASGSSSKAATKIAVLRLMQAGVTCIDTLAIISLIMKTFDRPDFAHWCGIIGQVSPHFRLLIDVYKHENKAAWIDRHNKSFYKGSLGSFDKGSYDKGSYDDVMYSKYMDRPRRSTMDSDWAEEERIRQRVDRAPPRSSDEYGAGKYNLVSGSGLSSRNVGTGGQRYGDVDSGVHDRSGVDSRFTDLDIYDKYGRKIDPRSLGLRSGGNNVANVGENTSSSSSSANRNIVPPSYPSSSSTSGGQVGNTSAATTAGTSSGGFASKLVDKTERSLLDKDNTQQQQQQQQQQISSRSNIQSGSNNNNPSTSSNTGTVDDDIETKLGKQLLGNKDSDIVGGSQSYGTQQRSDDKTWRQ